jgi:hypothetical protein
METENVGYVLSETGGGGRNEANNQLLSFPIRFTSLIVDLWRLEESEQDENRDSCRIQQRTQLHEFNKLRVYISFVIRNPNRKQNVGRKRNYFIGFFALRWFRYKFTACKILRRFVPDRLPPGRCVACQAASEFHRR